jgi:TPR repeat protein
MRAALDFFCRAADNGMDGGMHSAAQLLIRGVPREIEADPRRAAQYLGKAARSSDPRSREIALANLHFFRGDREVAAACCAGCGQTEKAHLKTCSKCGVAKYCGASCQKRMWADHKAICSKWKMNSAGADLA